MKIVKLTRDLLKSMGFSTLFCTIMSGSFGNIRQLYFVLVCAPIFGVLIFLANLLKRRLPKWSFAWSVLSTTVIYYIVAGFALCLSYVLLHQFRISNSDRWPSVFEYVRGSDFRFVMLWILICLFFSVILEEVAKKMGPSVLLNWVLGRYYKPREEQRIFMFLDMKDSTTHAETLGNLRFSALIQDFMKDLSEPIRQNRAEISHYIGDSAVICWKMKQGLRDDRCVQLFFDFLHRIDSKASQYHDRYGFVPTFKAAIHGGEVVTTEVGEIKSEIVFHGDVLNTTARMEALCNSVDQNLLISEDIRSQLSLDRYQLTDLGSQPLRGKKQTITVFGVAEKS
jgi:adenylate cyclase